MYKKTESNGNRNYNINGKEYVSVTTILKVISKPSLYFWYAKHGTAKMWKVLDEIPKEDRERILAKHPDLIKNPQDIMSEASDIGKEVHNAIDDYVKGKEVGKLNEITEKCFHAFIEWSDKVGLVTKASELQIYSDKYKYAGTLDFVGEIDGKLCLADWKSSSGIYKEYSLQLSAYRRAYLEMNKNVKLSTDMYLVRLGKYDGKFEIKVFKDSKDLFDAFLSAKKLWDWQNGK